MLSVLISTARPSWRATTHSLKGIFRVRVEHPKCAVTQNPPEERTGVRKRSPTAVSTPYFSRFGFSFQLAGSEGSNSNSVQLKKSCSVIPITQA